MAVVAACNNLGAAARDKREREIEREVSREIEACFARDGITPEGKRCPTERPHRKALPKNEGRSFRLAGRLH